MVRHRTAFDKHDQNPFTMARPITLLFCLLLATLSFAATTRHELLVHFDKDESVLTQAAQAELDAFIATLQLSGDHAFTVHGHTDSDGSVDYNEALSQARAETVLQYLVEHGVDAARVSIDRSGELDPLATNAHGEGMALNRRVQVTYTLHSYADTEELRRALMEGTVQHFPIDPTRDQVVVGSSGTQLSFQANAFVDAHGRPVSGTVDVELTEALGLQAMLAHQLSTRSGSRMLETGGMLKVRATDSEGNELRLQAASPMQVALPAASREEGMELFESSDGSDWTSTTKPLTVSTVTTWREPPYPSAPRLPFRFPHFREDQGGRPVKPVEPTLPKAPTAPRAESYQRARPWWAFLFPERADQQAAYHYQQALVKHAVQMERYEKKRSLYETECSNYPERLQRYMERKAEWDSLKQAEYQAWHTNTFQPARERYDQMMAPLRARYDSLMANYRETRTASMQQYVLRSDSMNTADIGGLNAYVFTTSRLGWINCDRFYDVPEDQKYSVVADARRHRDAQVFLVFNRIRSMMQMGHDRNGQVISPLVARAEPATLFAYTVIDGQAHVCLRPVSPSARPELVFEPSSFAEIGELLRSLGNVGG
jgi:outer membrane protein OmpA-like peptidoglycan-associated protein